MALTDTKCRNLKDPKKYFDRDGLYLNVQKLKSGNLGKYWRYDFTFGGKGQTASYGTYPKVSLAEAREKNLAAHKLIEEGINPCVAKRKKHLENTHARSFADVAAEWLSKREKRVSPATLRKDRLFITKYANKAFGNIPIKDIEPVNILHMLQKIEQQGTYETLRRVKRTTRSVFRHAVGLQLIPREIVSDVADGFIIPESDGYPFIEEPKRISELLNDIDAYGGEHFTKLALKLLLLTFVRPGELRFMAWEEIDWEKKEWHIKEDRIKQRRDHIVPLARQSLAILAEMKQHQNSLPLVFYSLRSKSKAYSENTYNQALRRMGYPKEEVVAHGFRKTASTRLNAMQKYNSDWIEAQLSHADRQKTRAIYNKYDYLPERTVMMQEWANYLDNLKKETSVHEN